MRIEVQGQSTPPDVVLSLVPTPTGVELQAARGGNLPDRVLVRFFIADGSAQVYEESFRSLGMGLSLP